MMKRTSTLLLSTAISIAVGMFYLKYRVIEQEQALNKIHKEIYAAEESIHVLQAEYAYLSAPERLQALATKHLKVNPTQVVQLVSFDQIPDRAIIDTDEQQTLLASWSPN